ncbi:hypothetical protein BJ994_000439 [Arthrobacter pigmenti]|uniref:Uncharacterized protein n=1 Tax=Arthrobacter pigmenti TaxID=271432 RepID=A0A846REA8_9MICC|nr:hypothetical protein [Arthrobacter pigmenti]
MRGTIRNNSLSIFFGVIFLLALIGQALTGVALYNEQQVASGLDQIGLGRYLTSSAFAVDVSENWQSEYLQFLLYIFATVWFVQKGSPESKELDKTGRESDEEQKVGKYAEAKSPEWAKAGGWRLAVFSRSLGIVMGLIFLLSWLVQYLAGRVAFNEEQLANLQDPYGFAEYLGSPEFWNRTLQNWQSEFLAVGSMAVLSIYLRQRGSPESKPVGAEHSATAQEG